MTHLIYIYLIFNSFLLGGYCNSSEYRFDSNWNRGFYIFFLVFFGGILSFVIHPLIWIIKGISAKN